MDSSKKKICIVIAIITVLVMVIILAVRLTKSSQRGSASKLDNDTTKVQTEVQKKAKNDSIIVDSVLVRDGNWRLIRTKTSNITADNNLVIANGDKIILGPGTSFSVDDLVNNNVSDKIIRYFYKGVLWVNFNEYKDSYLAGISDDVKTTIQIFAGNTGTSLDKVVLIKDSIKSSLSDTSDNKINITEFRFKLNNSGDVYTMRVSVPAIGDREFSVLDNKGNVLYSRTESMQI